jgi:uncharacterized protein
VKVEALNVALTFLQLAEKVLLETTTPLSVDQIWSEATNHGYVNDLNGSGKTPLHTLGAQLCVNVKTGSTSEFVGVGSRPKRFYLRTRHAEMNLSDSVLAADAVPAPVKGHYLEKDLHPFLVYFASESGLNGRVYTKTLNHSKSTKDSYGQWMHPDMVGCYFPEWHDETKSLSQALGNSSLRLFSFEIKRVLSFQNLRESFFQAVSNSSWANQGYLCAAQISEDPVFHEELQRLSESFGIGVIELDIAVPSASRVLFQVRDRSIDWEFVDKLCDLNPDFRDFLKRVKIDFSSQPHKSEYDPVLSAEQLKTLITV